MTYRPHLPICFTIVLITCTAQPPARAKPTTRPTTAPAPRVTDLTGQPADVFAGAADRRATVLLFVTTECPISNGYAPEVRRICDAYSRQNIAFHLVYPDPDVTLADAQKHHKDYGHTCPAVLDPKHELVKKAGATITPEAAVFLPTGRLVYRGRINDLHLDYGKSRFAPTAHDLRDVLERVVQNQPVEPRFTTAVGCHIPE
jgi:hypothetical protein